MFDNATDPVAGVRDCFDTGAEVLIATDYADACPIETVALEVASTDELLRQVTAEIFTGWIDSATPRFAAAGLDQVEARRLALAFLAALEGAFVLARALKSPEPLHAAGASCVAAIEAAIEAAANEATLTP